jgi:uncharacterized membrane protein
MYFFMKWLHVITAALLFGTGLGIAFFMFLAYRAKNIITLKQVTHYVVLADWIFTTPAVILQPLTGIWLMHFLHYPFNSVWFLAILSLYILIGACWIPVVFIQYQLYRQVLKLSPQDVLPHHYHRLMHIWVCLGIPAFSMVIVIYWLMITRAGLSTSLF